MECSCIFIFCAGPASLLEFMHASKQQLQPHFSWPPVEAIFEQPWSDSFRMTGFSAAVEPPGEAVELSVPWKLL